MGSSTRLETALSAGKTGVADHAPDVAVADTVESRRTVDAPAVPSGEAFQRILETRQPRDAVRKDQIVADKAALAVPLNGLRRDAETPGDFFQRHRTALLCVGLQVEAAAETLNERREVPDKSGAHEPRYRQRLFGAIAGHPEHDKVLRIDARRVDLVSQSLGGVHLAEPRRARRVAQLAVELVDGGDPKPADARHAQE